jgi:hypothetical protein
MKATVQIFAFFSLILASCSTPLTPFTRTLYDEQNFTDSDLKRIQFFLSSDLVLYRYLDEKADYQINGGSVRVRDGRKTQEVVIKQGTPGVFISRPNSDHFAISFEEADNAKFLMFGPNPKNGGRYELLASDWNRRTGTVTYDNAKFKTYSEVIPKLMVDLKQSRTNTRERKTVSGRKVE